MNDCKELELYALVIDFGYGDWTPVGVFTSIEKLEPYLDLESNNLITPQIVFALAHVPRCGYAKLTKPVSPDYLADCDPTNKIKNAIIETAKSRGAYINL